MLYLGIDLHRKQVTFNLRHDSAVDGGAGGTVLLTLRVRIVTRSVTSTVGIHHDGA